MNFESLILQVRDMLVLGAYFWLVSSHRYLGMVPMILTLLFLSIAKIALNWVMLAQ
jgi:hypothetical protein